MNILLAKESDLNVISKCHLEAFPNSFTSALGERFLKKSFQWYLINDNTFLLVAKYSDGQIAGYAGGMVRNTNSLHGSSTSIIQYTFKELILAILIKPWIIFHPEILSNYTLIIKNIRLKIISLISSGKSKNKSTIKTNSLGLVVIGTSLGARGKGVGSNLLKAFELKGRSLKVQRMHLSVKKNNKEAIRAYKANGWIEGVLKGGDLQMYKIICDISSISNI
jgi:ribosomal protein S18 acetylase RimI-like enzyme